MTPKQFSRIVKNRFAATNVVNDLGFSSLARFTGYRKEQIWRWTSGKSAIPIPIIIILVLMETMDLTREDVEDFTAKATGIDPFKPKAPGRPRKATPGEEAKP